MVTVSQGINTAGFPPSQQAATLAERTNRMLLKIIRNNFSTQYATQASSLARFRDVVSTHGGTEVDTTLLEDFRSHVPVSNNNSYKPFVDKFNTQPCRKEEVENLLAPGLPDFFAITSATSNPIPKFLPKYDHSVGAPIPRCPFFDPNNQKPLAALVWCGYMHLKEIEHAPGQVVQRIPVCIVTGGSVRRCFGWKIDDDEARMPLKMPFYVVPWAATIISHIPSFLTIHGLFFLACRDVDHFYAPFAPFFVDLIRNIDEQWDMLVSCIRNGILPELESINHVRGHLQAHFHADTERAAELLEIGPPFSLEGWAARVWPKANSLVTRSSGVVSLMVPKIKSIMGHIPLRCPGYGATEGGIGISHSTDKPDEFVLWSEEVVEFLDVSEDETHENIRQAWEVEVGKQYEPILTTRDGLWRYQLGDILSIVGFNPESKAPIFKYAGRKSPTIRLPHAQITDNQLLEIIKTISSEDTIQVQEFTTVVDDRMSPPTLNLFVELARPLGPSAHLVPQKLFDALVATDVEHLRALENGQMRLPTIHIVKAGTFADYRSFMSELRNITSGQFKVPLVLVIPSAQELILEKVVQKL